MRYYGPPPVCCPLGRAVSYNEGWSSPLVISVVGWRSKPTNRLGSYQCLTDEVQGHFSSEIGGFLSV